MSCFSADKNNKEQQEAVVVALEKTTFSKSLYAAVMSKLDDEYKTLDREEQELLVLLKKTQREEICLRNAIKEASETGAQRRTRDMQAKNEAAVARLESALFADSSSSSSSDDEDGEEMNGKSIPSVAV